MGSYVSSWLRFTVISSSSITYLQYSSLLILVLSVINISSSSQSSIIKTLPGFDGDLPFKLETGYIGVGENNEHEYFYYFIESERDPENDPLVLSLTGGPGCSSLYALAFEIGFRTTIGLAPLPHNSQYLISPASRSTDRSGTYGPIMFDSSSFGSTLPSLILRPYPWTKISNVIFLDQPVGAGFSYPTNSPDGYHTNDTETAKHIYDFLVKWLKTHPKFIKNSLYIQGESYAGKMVPMITWEIVKANEAGHLPRMSLQGYIVANPATDQLYENDGVIFAHKMGLISDEYMKIAEKHCNGRYVKSETDNIQCEEALKSINECIGDIYPYNILEPDCLKKNYGPRQDQTIDQRENSTYIILPSETPKIECRSTYYTISESWANNPLVREALHVREGTKGEWVRCNRTLTAYDINIQNVVDLHRILNKKGYNCLVYSGDHDMVVPYINSLNWIQSLNLTLNDSWRPWRVNKQIAGYTVRYKGDEAYITFATIKGAGHTPPEYKPEEVFNMISHWFSNVPL